MPKAKTIRRRPGGPPPPPGMGPLEEELWHLATRAAVPHGVWLPVRGKPEMVHDLSYENLRRLIGGGYVEAVRLMSGNILIVDEEGLIKRLPFNALATEIMEWYRHHSSQTRTRLSWWAAARPPQGTGSIPIVGDVVFIPGTYRNKILK